MSEPFIGEIRIFSFNFAPKGWAQCNGQLLGIQQNQALFAILGTTYGGDGIRNFALPNFEGRAPIHWGNAAGGGSFVIGEQGGEINHTLLITELAAHTHTLNGSNTTANTPDPATAVYANSSVSIYNNGSSSHVAMAADAISNTGGNQPHNNMQPFLVLNFCIATVGTFPSRN